MTERIPFDVEGLVELSTSGNCFICECLKDNPDYSHILIDETDYAVAFLNKFPTLFGYILVAPKQHLTEVTGSFSEREYLQLQRFVFSISDAVRKVLSPARIYILSLGSNDANEHVHWHIAPLSEGVPLDQQQYYALMHENGVVETTEKEMQKYVEQIRSHLTEK